MEDLAAGKADAFAIVHAAAMLSLVTNPTPVKSDTIPETLLFDVGRVSLLQGEFDRIVGCATVLTMATHAVIGSDKSPSKEKLQVMSDLVDLIKAGGVFDSTEFCRSLDSAGVLTNAAARDKFLKTLALSVENKGDPVRQLM
jgi:hypothetical protein